MNLIEGLADTQVHSCPARGLAAAPSFGRNRNAQERIAPGRDPVDAVFAPTWRSTPSDPHDVTLYGDADTGYILTPTLPVGLTPQSPEPIPASAPSAVADYEARRPALEAVTENYLQLVTAFLDDAGINYLSITARTKSVESFAAKVERTVDGRRLFSDPLVEITDQVGLRIITYLREDVDAVVTLLADEMRLLDDRDMGLETAREGRWGYASSTCSSASAANSSPRRSRCAPCFSTHGRSSSTRSATRVRFPPNTRRTWIDDSRWRPGCSNLPIASSPPSASGCGPPCPKTMRTAVDETDPRIATPVLATYLGNRYADAGWSRTDHYAWISGLLLELGITSLDELSTVLDSVDAGAINKKMGYRYPPGAVRRLDDALLDVFGERYLHLHGNAHRVGLLQERLKRLRNGPATAPA